MENSHTFQKTNDLSADKITYNKQRNLVVLHWNCKNRNTKYKFLPPEAQTKKPCQAVKKQFYAIYSVNNRNETIKIKDTSLEDAPEWVSKVVKILKNKIKNMKADNFVSRLYGEMFKIMVVTSDSEYNIKLKSVDERICEY